MIFSIHYIRFLFLTFFSIILFSSCNKDNEPVDEDIVVEFLKNTTLEEGVNGIPDGWFSTDDNNIYELDWTTDESHSPNKSLSITAERGDTTEFAFWGQNFNVDIPHGEDVTLTVWVKSNLLGNGVSIAIRGDDTEFPEGSGEQFASTQGNIDITGSFDWSKYSVTLENVDTDIKSVTVYLIYLPETAGTVYFDDIQLQ